MQVQPGLLCNKGPVHLQSPDIFWVNQLNAMDMTGRQHIREMGTSVNNGPGRSIISHKTCTATTSPGFGPVISWTWTGHGFPVPGLIRLSGQVTIAGSRVPLKHEGAGLRRNEYETGSKSGGRCCYQEMPCLTNTVHVPTMGSWKSLWGGEAFGPVALHVPMPPCDNRALHLPWRDWNITRDFKNARITKRN